MYKQEIKGMTDKDKIWQAVLKDVKNNCTQPTYDGFFSGTTLKKLDNEINVAYVATGSTVAANVLSMRYISMISSSLENVTGSRYKVVVKTEGDYKTENNVLKAENRTSKAYNLNINFMKEKIFNPKYTFDNFVVGESNKYAASAAMAVAKDPANTYNPFFIYGGSGLGKTHLLNAIGIYILEHKTDKNIIFVSSETFTNDVVTGIENKKMDEVRDKYRKADVLIVDDIQFFEGKEATQEEFFHTFNILYDEHKQIIITSDRPPENLTKLDDRLKSRFGWNMVVDIQPPDYETRVAILKKKAVGEGVEIDDDMEEVFKLIARNITDNIRLLEGALTRLLSFSQSFDEHIDMAFAKRVINDVISGSSSTITPENIKKAVCRHFKIKMSDLEGKSRKNSIAFPRQIAMYLCREMTDYSNVRIGSIFGNRDHSTVMHACKKVKGYISSDDEIRNVVKSIEESIKD